MVQVLGKTETAKNNSSVVDLANIHEGISKSVTSTVKLINYSVIN
jgi:hypothetical protein